MKCDLCGCDLRIGKVEFTSEKDSTDVFSVQPLICVNPDCNNYGGTDLTNPTKVSKSFESKVN